jgi:GNAT superfamily N-acetyltransferase
MVTHEVDYLPVVGVYVAQERRGEGLARLLVSSVLGYGLGQGYLVGGQEIFCSDHRWARYPEILEGCGLRARAWE